MPGTILECAAAKGLELALMSVAITGTVEYANTPAAFNIKKGDPAKVSFYALRTAVDRRGADDPKFVVQDSMAMFPICNETFSFSVGPLTGSIGAFVPPEFVQPAWLTDATFFTLASKRPVLDEIFVSPSPYKPDPMPLVMTGTQGLYPKDWQLSFDLMYTRGTLPAIKMPQAASKKYTSEGLVKSTMRLATTYFPSNEVVSIKLDSVSIAEAADAYVGRTQPRK